MYIIFSAVTNDNTMTTLIQKHQKYLRVHLINLYDKFLERGIIVSKHVSISKAFKIFLQIVFWKEVILQITPS